MRTLLLASLLLCRAALAASTTWTTASSPPGPHARENTSVLYSNGLVYVVGGYDGADPLTEAWQAPLALDGTLGAFTATTATPVPRYASGITWIGNHLYLLGGDDNSVLTSLEGASLGSWQSLQPFSNGRTQGAAVAFAGRLFVMGGVSTSGTTWFGDVQSVPIQVDYSVGPSWGAETASFTPRSLFGFTTLPGPGGSLRLYMLGGYNSGQMIREVLFASINSTGALSGFTATTPLPTPRYAACAFADGDFVYLAGGVDPNGYLSDVIAARVQSDGSLGPWLPQPPLPDARGFCGATSGSHTAVLVGGIGPQGAVANQVRNDVLYATLSSPGAAAHTAYLGPALYSSQVGTCAGPFTLELRDMNGQPTQAEQKQTLPCDVRGTAQPGSFFDDPNCASPSSTFQVQVGAARGSQYFKATTPGRYTIEYGSATLGDGSFDVEFTLGSTGPGSDGGTSADGGTAAAPDPHSVNGWGCSSTPLAPSALLAALVWLMAGRRRLTGPRARR
jgi:hypothetical protein